MTTPLISSKLIDIIIAEDGEVEAILQVKLRPIKLLRIAREEGKSYDHEKARAYKESKKHRHRRQEEQED